MAEKTAALSCTSNTRGRTALWVGGFACGPVAAGAGEGWSPACGRELRVEAPSEFFLQRVQPFFSSSGEDEVIASGGCEFFSTGFSKTRSGARY